MTPMVTIVQALRRAVPEHASLCLDSRDIGPGDVFVAAPGLSGDGRDHIADAIARGAHAVIHEAGLTELQQTALGQTSAWSVAGLRQQLGELGALWWSKPSSALTVIAITGTNGKTTTAQWLVAALAHQGIRAGVIGTLGMSVGATAIAAGGLTTPDVLSMHRHLAGFVAQGVTHVVIEASSIGLDQGRLDGIEIDIAVFTNLTQDHLDYHGDMQTYARAKARLFQWPTLKHAVVNADDPYALQVVAGASAPVLRFSVRDPNAQCYATAHSDSDGQVLSVRLDAQSFDLPTAFVGAHAAANLLAVTGALHCLGWSVAEIAGALTALPAVPGRLEPVLPIGTHGPVDLPKIYVDYAHTPDALKNVLQALRPVVAASGGHLWCVVGCGGNRDIAKRPMMAAVASQHADQVVLTSDNPRDESPHVILAQMRQGAGQRTNVQQQADRAIAILTTIWQARDGDVVVIAGKGHEQYQEIEGRREPFDDRQWARLALLMMRTTPPVQTDTRKLSPGALFVALRGQRFDGHEYLSQAKQSGAIAALVQTSDPAQALPQIVVGPTLPALQRLATAWRRRFTLPVIGVTGSNGKTTTKEMITAICHQWVGQSQTLSTTGNMNNEIGVPLMVLRLRNQHRVAVIEMGMNHPGEIAVLAAVAQPTIALVLNAQREHQEFMQSVQAVAQENGQALCALPADGVAVFPHGDTHSDGWQAQSAHVSKQRTFGYDRQASLCVSESRTDGLGSQFRLTIDGASVEISLPVAGQHNVLNATAACACATAAGATLRDCQRGLEQFKAVKGRLQVHRLGSGLTLLDDTYNANPDSVRAAIDVLQALPAPRALVLGDMGEVGSQGPAVHTEIGHYARERSVQYLWALGQATQDSVTAFGEGARLFDSPESLFEYAMQIKPASVLVKGSRFMAMERIVDHLIAATSKGQASREAGHAR